ncbi:prostate and testis expressed protein 3 [Paroedura picta]|uniref:prostate and testis expressed protein 3 n=1 Tax=Paroedura picta TaxID=143630 RepID=UPI00405662F6
MHKFLACGLWILLSISSVSAVWCHHCETKSVKERCPMKEEARCWTAPGETCYSQNLYLGNKILFMRYGCFKGCRYIYKTAKFMWHSVTCCNKNYCNK